MYNARFATLKAVGNSAGVYAMFIGALGHKEISGVSQVNYAARSR